VWALALVSCAPAQDLSAILQRIEKLEQENRALKAQVRALEDRLDGKTAETEVAAVPVEQQIAVEQKRVEDLAQTKVEAAQKFPLRIAGMALFNAYLNSKGNGGAEYPVAASAPVPGNAGATLRQTIVGLEYRGPSTVWGGNVHGSVYMDFFAGAANQTARLRTGDIEIDWKTRSVMAGVEKPIFNPREPSSLAQVGISPLTGTGNLWQWLPQVRVQQDLSFGRSSGLRAQMGVVQTREVGPYVGSTFNAPLDPARPALEGRFEFYHKLDDDRRIEIAPGFHTSTTHANGVSIPSQIFSMDWFMNPWRRVEFTGAFYSGQNVAPLGNGYEQGFYGYGRYLAAVPSVGGWAQVTVHTLPRVDLHLFSGQQDDKNEDLAAGRIGKNWMFGGNVYYRIAPNVLVGVEVSQLRTWYIGQGVRINNHYDLAWAYLF
jgi:hypothetical protein